MQPQVVIVGGGVVGAAAACFLARDHGVPVTVIERDRTYSHASSALSASSIRQQFSTPVNIALSQWSMGFLRSLGDELAVAGEPPAIGLVEAGYLVLATPAGAQALRSNYTVQRASGPGRRVPDREQPGAGHAVCRWQAPCGHGRGVGGWRLDGAAGRATGGAPAGGGKEA